MKKYWILIICLSLVFAAGLFNGTMDTLHFHYGNSVFPTKQGDTYLGKDIQFWNPSISWMNKYKDWPSDRRPAFPGAITWAVAFTDGWHLLKYFMMSCYNLAIIIPIIYLYKFPRWIIFIAVVPLNLFFGAAFTIMYGYLLVKKNKT